MADDNKNSMEISRDELYDFDTYANATITDVKHIASYNWIEAPTPVIVVPGAPPLWTAPTGTRTVPKDAGLRYINQNAARHPESPLEPLFRAVFLTDPSLDIRAVDVVADRNCMRKLLAFLNDYERLGEPESFSIRVEIVKNTAIFCRDQTKTQEYIGPNEFRGFGHEFEKAYTTSQIKDSTSHHRIVSYRFGGMKFIVRHETDGYVDDVAGAASSANPSGSSEDDLTSKLASLFLTPSTKTSRSISTKSKLTVKEEGHVVPLAATLEIKTRVAHKPLSIENVAPQLWISQTPKLVRAYHKRGTFKVPEVKDVKPEIDNWEAENQTCLRSLASLISKIVGSTKCLGGNAVINYDAISDKLTVRKINGNKMLPEDLYLCWDNTDGEVSQIGDLTGEITH